MNDAGQRAHGELDLEALSRGDPVATEVLVEQCQLNPGLVFEPEVFTALQVLARKRDWATLLARLASAGVDAAALERALKAQDEFSESTDWPQREPIVGGLKPVESFNPVLLPDAIRDWVMDEAWRMPCPPDFIAATLIVELSSVIGAHCSIKPKPRDTWQVVPNLWGGVVGNPSSKKTPASNAAMKPLDRLVAIAQKIFDDETRLYQVKNFAHEAHLTALKDKLKSTARKDHKSAAKNDTEDDDDEGRKDNSADVAQELQDFIDQAPKPPLLRRFKTNDPTTEKLGELLRDNPRGILVYRDEIVGLLASWEKDGRESDRAFYLESYNGNAAFDYDRIARGHIHIPNLCASLLGGIQPDKLAKYLRMTTKSLDNDGLFQRFQLLVYPDRPRWEWRDAAAEPSARDQVYEVFDRLANFKPTAWGAAPKGEYDKFDAFLFSNEAQDIFIRWSAELNHEKIEKEDDPVIEQHLAKYESLFCSLALIFHLIDCAAHGIRGPVSKDSAIRAAAWCDYLESHARRCYGLVRDAGLRAAQMLARKLERGILRTGFTAYDIRRHQWSGLQESDEVELAIDWLKNSGWIRPLPPAPHPQGGRPTTRYEVHPDLPLEPGQ
jgi:hypothetical protein